MPVETFARVGATSGRVASSSPEALRLRPATKNPIGAMIMNASEPPPAMNSDVNDAVISSGLIA